LAVTGLGYQCFAFSPLALTFSVTSASRRGDAFTSALEEKGFHLHVPLSCLELPLADYPPHGISRNGLGQTNRTQRFIIAVPVGAKLPRLLERALTLCSGYVATFVEGLPFSPEIRGFNLFRAIPPQIAEMTAKKLGQTLSTHSLDIQF
jgi:hypothetical protein